MCGAGATRSRSEACGSACGMAARSAAAEAIAVEHPLLDHAVHVESHRAHHAAEHRVIAGHDQKLDELGAAELGFAAGYQLGGRLAAVQHRTDDLQHECLARGEGLTADLAALD